MSRKNLFALAVAALAAFPLTSAMASCSDRPGTPNETAAAAKSSHVDRVQLAQHHRQGDEQARLDRHRRPAALDVLRHVRPRRAQRRSPQGSDRNRPRSKASSTESEAPRCSTDCSRTRSTASRSGANGGRHAGLHLGDRLGLVLCHDVACRLAAGCTKLPAPKQEPLAISAAGQPGNIIPSRDMGSRPMRS